MERLITLSIIFLSISLNLCLVSPWGDSETNFVIIDIMSNFYYITYWFSFIVLSYITYFSSDKIHILKQKLPKQSAYYIYKFQISQYAYIIHSFIAVIYNFTFDDYINFARQYIIIIYSKHWSYYYYIYYHHHLQLNWKVYFFPVVRSDDPRIIFNYMYALDADVQMFVF